MIGIEPSSAHRYGHLSEDFWPEGVGLDADFDALDETEDFYAGTALSGGAIERGFGAEDRASIGPFVRPYIYRAERRAMEAKRRAAEAEAKRRDEERENHLRAVAAVEAETRRLQAVHQAAEVERRASEQYAMWTRARTILSGEIQKQSVAGVPFTTDMLKRLELRVAWLASGLDDFIAPASQARDD